MECVIQEGCDYKTSEFWNHPNGTYIYTVTEDIGRDEIVEWGSRKYGWVLWPQVWSLLLLCKTSLSVVFGQSSSPLHGPGLTCAVMGLGISMWFISNFWQWGRICACLGKTGKTDTAYFKTSFATKRDRKEKMKAKYDIFNSYQEKSHISLF